MVAGCPCRGWRNLGGWWVDFANRALRKMPKIAEEVTGKGKRENSEEKLYTE